MATSVPSWALCTEQDWIYFLQHQALARWVRERAGVRLQRVKKPRRPWSQTSETRSVEGQGMVCKLGIAG